MQINWIGYYDPCDGYGRFNAYLVRELQAQGVEVVDLLPGDVWRPAWMQQARGVDWGNLTISCVPVYELQKVPGRHWLYTMTEGSELPGDWADIIAECNIERLIVPCRANAEAFRRGGVTIPIHVVHGGTNPNEFAPTIGKLGSQPFTVLTLADRASRKGWLEVWRAFYLAFGPATTGQKDVRLIVKCRPDANDAVTALTRASNRDGRVTFWEEDVPHPRNIYEVSDVVALPSRFEGWGMPHRESAMMGIPTIVQKHSGLDDGHTDVWAFVVGGHVERIPVEDDSIIYGEWSRASIPDIARALRHCYEKPQEAKTKALRGAKWLADHQTWQHTVANLLQLIHEHEPAMALVTGG